MKILFLCHRIPYPPNKGDKIRSFHEIKHFSKNHEIHLLAFCENSNEISYGNELKKYCRSVSLILIKPHIQRIKAAIFMLQGKPWTLGYFSDRAMRDAVQEKLNTVSFDVVFAYSSSMAPYALTAARIPRVLDFVDSDACKWRRYAQLEPAPKSWLHSYEASKLARFEQEMILKFDASIFVSPREASHLTGGIHFIQNGVNLDYFAAFPREKGSNLIIFTGAMDYFPNIDAVTFFAENIFPLIRSYLGDAQFLIVGSRPTSAVRRLERSPGITVTGTVLDIRPNLAKASVAVVPLRISQGIQNKILEALAADLPVVATRSAAEGLQTIEGLPISVTDDPKEFSDRVLDYLRNPLGEEEIKRCRHHLELQYSWEKNLSAFDHIFHQLHSHKIEQSLERKELQG